MTVPGWLTGLGIYRATRQAKSHYLGPAGGLLQPDVARVTSRWISRERGRRPAKSDLSSNADRLRNRQARLPAQAFSRVSPWSRGITSTAGRGPPHMQKVNDVSCSSAAAARASRRKRSRIDGFAASRGRMTLRPLAAGGGILGLEDQAHAPDPSSRSTRYPDCAQVQSSLENAPCPAKLAAGILGISWPVRNPG